MHTTDKTRGKVKQGPSLLQSILAHDREAQRSPKTRRQNLKDATPEAEAPGRMSAYARRDIGRKVSHVVLDALRNGRHRGPRAPTRALTPSRLHTLTLAR